MSYPARVSDLFQTRFGQRPALIVRAPGRINLIGEHTDYNMGFVLPAAIDKAIYFAAAPRQDTRLCFVAENLDAEFSGDIQSLEKSALGWPNYLLGILYELQQAGYQLKNGLDIVFGGDIPNGAGVSSSAALEGGMIGLLEAMFGLGIPKMEQVKMAQRAENRFVGVNCGIMDMFASIMGRQNACLRIDCRSLEHTYFPFDAPDFALVLCDTGVKHSLVDSDFNTRRGECEVGVRLLAEAHPNEVKSLRDATPDMLLAEKKRMPAAVFRRCRYVVAEIGRVQAACAALPLGQFDIFGQLMYETHAGLQHDYEVSCPELDFLVDETRDNDAVLGARMMGAGFGGCTINLVRRSSVPAFLERMQVAYTERFGRRLACHVVSLSDGVGLIS